MKKLIALLLLISILPVHSGFSKNGKSFAGAFSLKEGTYIANTILIRVKASVRSFCGTDFITEPKLKQVFEQIQVTSVKKIFPNAKVPAESKNKSVLF